MTIQNPDRIETVKNALVTAGLANAGQSPSGKKFFTSSAVCIGEGAGGLVMIYLLSHPGMSGPGRSAADMKMLRNKVEAALAGIEGVEIQRHPMGRVVANAA